MSTEVIENYPDAVCIRVVVTDELAHLLDKLFLHTLFRHIDMAPAAERFANQEEVTRSSATIRVIGPCDRSRVE
nr:hypothetical protein [Natronococcus sp. JC468]